MAKLEAKFKNENGVTRRLDDDGVWREAVEMKDDEGYWWTSIQDEKLF